MTIHQINNIFKYHAPTTATRVVAAMEMTQTERYEILRADARKLAQRIEEACPESREKSLAITKLQEAIMFANAAIAINE